MTDAFLKRYKDAIADSNINRRITRVLDLNKEYIQDLTNEGFFINSNNENLLADLDKGGLVFNDDTAQMYVKNSAGVIYRSAFTSIGTGIIPSITNITKAVGGYIVGDTAIAITGLNLNSGSSISMATSNTDVTIASVVSVGETSATAVLTIADVSALDTTINVTITVDGLVSAEYSLALDSIPTVSMVVSGGAFGSFAIGTYSLTPTSYTAPVTGTAPVDETWKYNLTTTGYTAYQAHVELTDIKGLVKSFDGVTTVSDSVIGLSNNGVIDAGAFTSYTLGGTTVTIAKENGWT